MSDIAKDMIDKIDSKDTTVIEKIKMLFWIEKYLWSVVEVAMDDENK